MLFQMNALLTTARYMLFLGFSVVTLSCSASHHSQRSPVIPPTIAAHGKGAGHVPYALQQLSTYRQLQWRLASIEPAAQ